jgi:hypothetical protein
MLREQAKVERVQDGTHTGHRVVELEVPVIVERERCHPIAGFDAEPLERARQPVDSRHHLGVGHPVHAMVELRHHLLLMVQALDPPEHMLK